jgi:hypothetical protein
MDISLKINLNILLLKIKIIKDEMPIARKVLLKNL